MSTETLRTLAEPMRLTLHEYAKLARRTRKDRGRKGRLDVQYGLWGEAGEFAEKLKKLVRDMDLDPTEPDFVEQANAVDPTIVPGLLKELGDMLWYVSANAEDLGSSLEEIALANIEKTSRRHQNGTLHGSGDDR